MVVDDVAIVDVTATFLGRSSASVPVLEPIEIESSMANTCEGERDARAVGVPELLYIFYV